MIKSIELTNWKTHKHTSINFQKGVNVLVGVMGAGKSSVIDGISYGLFGTFPMLNHKRTTTENLISNRPSEENEAQVRLVFTIGNDEYSVTRRISRKGPAYAKLEKNGDYLQEQPARVNEEIEGLIKVDYDTFSRAIYAEQNRIDYFLELAKGDRKKIIDQMLGLDNFARAEENSTSLLNNIKSIIGEEEQLLVQADVKGMRSQLEKLTDEKQQLEKEQKELESKHKECKIKASALEKELTVVKAKSEKSKALEKELAELSSRISTLKRELEKIKVEGISGKELKEAYERKNAAKNKCDTEIKRSREEESASTKTMSAAEEKIKNDKEKILKRDKLHESINGKDPERMQKEITAKETDMQNSVKGLSSLKGRREELAKWSKELEKHISKCPVCEKELDENTRKMLLEQKNAAIKEIDSQMASTEASIKKSEMENAALKKEVEKLSMDLNKLAEYKGVDELLDEHSAMEKEAKEKLKEIREVIKRLETEQKDYEKELSDMRLKLDAVNRREKYDNEIKELSITVEKKSVEAKAIQFDEKELYRLQESITNERSALSDIGAKMSGNERYMKSMDSQIADKMKSIANFNLMAERIENGRKQISNMSKFRSALVETEAQLRNSLVTSINALMQSVWSELYPYADYSSIRLNAKRDDYALEASTGTDGNGSSIWINIDGIASGGERSVACLTMRIALAMVIVPNLKWLILDEPTHNIDENGINKFINVLGNTLPNVVEQIFIITHDNSLKNIESAMVYSLERDKNKNEYTSVVES